MKLLVIGGTSFVGRHIVEQALLKGHEVVLFNRGKTNPDLFSECRRLVGDRRTTIGHAAKEHWDAVIDTSGYTPNDVKPVIEALKEKTSHYTFISTISVYDDYSKGDVNENSSKFTHTVSTDEVTGATYGPLKVMCEKEVLDGFGEKALIVRPCIIVGPHDPTDRFTYWALRATEDEPIAIPGGDRKVQWIDVRDLATWIVEMIEEKKTGIYNAASEPVSFESFIDELAAEQGVEKRTIPDDVTEKAELEAKHRFPFWIPISEQYPQGFLIVDASSAVKAGLSIRPLRVTADDTRKWAMHLDSEKCKAGPTKEIEKLLIENASEGIAKLKYKVSENIGFQVKNVEEAKFFYETVLGFRQPAQSSVSEVEFRTDRNSIFLIEGDKNLGPVMEIVVGDLEQAKQHLLEHGCEIIRWEGKGKYCYVKDPFGMIFNVWEEKK